MADLSGVKYIGDWPKLYKRTSTGSIEEWSIAVGAQDGTPVIKTTYGQLDGKMQTAVELVVKGKNIGKANETTAWEQAVSQAHSEWEAKKSRKGYTESLQAARDGENGGAGGIRPMLAQEFEKNRHKVIYPCYVQPKLDGIRCIAVVNSDMTVSLWSREQKPITAVPNINRAVQDLKLPVGTILDGELYNAELHDDFEKIVSCVRKKEPASQEEQDLIQYHVYDVARIPNDKALWTYNNRYHEFLRKHIRHSSRVFVVSCEVANSDAEVVAFRKKFQNEGYEGAMVRNLATYEEGKRSYNLLKSKEFQDAEFDIVGVEEGTGKMAGLAIFVCKAQNGLTFRCKMEGELEGLRKYLVDPSTWKGQKLTVKYFSLTNKGVPRFPVGLRLRDPNY